jgi:hypothetical protein
MHTHADLLSIIELAGSLSGVHRRLHSSLDIRNALRQHTSVTRFNSTAQPDSSTRIGNEIEQDFIKNSLVLHEFREEALAARTMRLRQERELPAQRPQLNTVQGE